MPVKHVDPDSREYVRDYIKGWNAYGKYGDGAITYVDRIGTDAAYDGYSDDGAGRPKYTWRDARRAGFTDVEPYLASLAEKEE